MTVLTKVGFAGVLTSLVLVALLLFKVVSISLLDIAAVLGFSLVILLAQLINSQKRKDD